MRYKPGVVFTFFIFQDAHLRSYASNLPWHPKWTPSVQSNVHGTTTLCVKGIAGNSIQAGATVIYLWAFPVHSACFFINFPIRWPS